VASGSPDGSAGIDSAASVENDAAAAGSSGSVVRVRITVRCVIASSTTGGTAATEAASILGTSASAATTA
jgi:hypothetical protein